jgi:ABC-2 type transport system permease protein
MAGLQAAFAPASLPWLVLHDVRVRARSQQGTLAKAVLVLVLAILPVIVGTLLAWRWRGLAMLPAELLGQTTLAMVVMALVMLSSAYAHVLRMGRDRGELELLLSAPIPAARAIIMRTASINAMVALPFLLLTTPFFVASALFGHWRWLAGPLVVVAMALAATATALTIAAGLDRLLGPARARLAAQLTGVLLGASMFVLGQAPNFAPHWFAAHMAVFDAPLPWPWDVPARALLGDPGALMAMLALAVLAARAAARLAASRLEAAPAPAAVEQTGAAARFGGSPLAVLFGKEWRLLRRDPELVAQIGQQLVFMVPIIALIFGGGQITPGRIAAAGVFVGGALSSSLAWLVIAAEDAPDLIAAAPVPASQVLLAKLGAALVPPMLLVLAVAALVVVRQPVAAALMLPMALVSGLTTAALQYWTRQPMKRSAFRQRYRSSLLMALGEFIVLGSLAAATQLLLAGSLWALLALAVPGLLLTGVWRFRVRPDG